MTQYSIPTGATPNAFEWSKIVNERRFTAESGVSKFQGRNGSRHGLTLQWINLTGSGRQALDGMLYGIDGGRNRVQVLPSRIGYKRRGVGGGSPLISAAFSAGAQAVTVDAATAGVTNWMRAGDWVNLANDLYKVTGDTNTNGSGEAIVEVWPPLVKDYADNTPLVISQAGVYGIFFETGRSVMPGSPFNASDFIASTITLSLEQDLLA